VASPRRYRPASAATAAWFASHDDDDDDADDDDARRETRGARPRAAHRHLALHSLSHDEALERAACSSGYYEQISGTLLFAGRV
jgi:hypothetical protein